MTIYGQKCTANSRTLSPFTIVSTTQPFHLSDEVDNRGEFTEELIRVKLQEAR